MNNGQDFYFVSRLGEKRRGKYIGKERRRHGTSMSRIRWHDTGKDMLVCFEAWKNCGHKVKPIVRIGV